MKRFALTSNGDLARYDYLARLGADRWAWEYLRRNPAFRADAAGSAEPSVTTGPCGMRVLRPTAWPTLAERWGLVLMGHPSGDGVAADVVWNRRAFPDQIEVTCVPRADGERCEIAERLAASCAITAVTDLGGAEYLLLRRNGRVIQLACSGASLLGLYPVRFKLTVPRLKGYARRIRLQRSLVEIDRQPEGGEPPKWTKTTQVLRDGLVALDGLSAGMGRREIAQTLYGLRRVREEWNSGSMQHAVAYLVRKAEALRAGAYLSQLLGCEHDGPLPNSEFYQ
ncbi:DUF2285 domain-containing protein [Glycocaulis profundi]|nr:DUF2285 domain-containing protein [Glycocaulis profundi]